MNSYRESYISDFAESVADKYCGTLKVDTELIASKEGITVCGGKYGNSFEAMIEHCPEEKDYPFHIYLNMDIIKHRDNLRAKSSFGHELGHYFIPEHKVKLINGESLTYDKEFNYVENPNIEKEAQCFSANLLMPPSKFRAQANGLTFGLEAILKLSNKFDTSRLSSALQYVKMDFIPTVLIKWTSDNRIHWKYLSKSFKKKIRNSYHFQFNPVRQTTEYEITNSSSSTFFGTAITKLSSWVYDIQKDSAQDILLYEQTMSLGQYGGISLLFPASLT